ncbi:MAG: mannitol dehydrogenase family protein, partial [Acetobacteraceae bacterium]|nr:mannitol dehydrogenase family protein [Acetobacteraceae bacterium]
MTPVALNRSNLGQVRPPVRVPAYDPATLTPGIVHLGLGNFHRAHMARYTHALMERRSDLRDWGIIGAGLLPADERMRDSLAPQDWLYTLVERSATEERVSVIGSIVRVIHAGDSPVELLEAIGQPEIRVVSL